MRRIQHCPYSPEHKKYGAEAHPPLPQDNSRKLTNKEIKQVQKIVSSILYYARVVDMTVSMALSLTASEQTKGTERTLLSIAPGRGGKILSIGYGVEHSFGCIIFERAKSS